MSRISGIGIFLFTLFSFGIQSANAQLQVRVRPVGLDQKAANAFFKILLESPALKSRLRGVRYRVLSGRLEESGSLVSPHFNVKIYDYTNNRLLDVYQSLGGQSAPVLRESHSQPRPTQQEYEEAKAILTQDATLGAAVRFGLYEVYQAMPGILPGPDRVLSVGLQPAQGGKRHEIVGVNLSRRTVIRFLPKGAPAGSLAAEAVCGNPNAHQPVVTTAMGQAAISVFDGRDPVWQFIVTRPASSSAKDGSGIDLQKIHYRGKLVLDQLHVPILNVLYEGNRCGPYRDWQNMENMFMAEGVDSPPGIRFTSQPPTTIFDTGSDRGNFAGIAVSVVGDEVVLTSELSAGWYRYLSQYRFHKDGTIRPRFGFSAVSDSCVCFKHFHHAYWRMDFRVAGADDNVVQVFNGSTWTNVEREGKFSRNAQNRALRIVSPSGGFGYAIEPGPADGTADEYGRGDQWVLKYHPEEIDDSRVRRSTQAELDAFLNDEVVLKSHQVIWYAVHFLHQNDSIKKGVHDGIVGPALRFITGTQRAR